MTYNVFSGTLNPDSVNQPVENEWWDTSMVICLGLGANDLHVVQLMPLPPDYLLLH